ncbi:DUF1501 domain-containing protein [Nocardioides sp. 616]|uniref:DUF1501 domain-containing protein n=1 Tax=Nocardioides sp. 616 TaxID=2268090 RepID=UPI000CE4CE2A|nr:DUF1501 domain-containing protein [Nocardioides sp. 616]
MSTPSTAACCDLTSSGMTRRGLFRAAAVTGGVLTFGSAVVATASAEPGVPAASVIVVLSLRGAADGLSLVVPHGDKTYYKARPTIAVPRGSLLAKDNTFGLHPALHPLLPMWQSGKLAAVHATGMRIPNRSHFAAMEAVEDADPGSAARVGWLNRLVGEIPGGSPARGLSVGTASMPTSLYGPQPVMAVTDLSKIQVSGADSTGDPRGTRRRALGTVWGADGTELGTGARSALAASTDLLPSLQQPDTSTAYPTSDLGQALAGVSRVLKANTGTSLVTVDQGDWDHHTGVGSITYGRMLNNSSDLGASIAAFFADLGPLADKVTLVTMSEFGRRVVENAQKGLDHGWGNVMFLAGAGVKGGRYYGKWPGLKNSLDADLEVTTDYRSVLAEVVASRTGASIATVFPGLKREHVGVMRGQ